MIFSSEYDALCDFHEGLAAVCTGVRRDMFLSDTDYEKNLDQKTGDYFFKKIEHEDNNPDIPYREAFPEEYDIWQKLSKEKSELRQKVYAAAYKDSKWGFIDKTGEVVIPLEYDYVNYSYYRFCNGFARVYKNGKHGYIDKTGGIVVPIEYDYIQEFHEGIAVVKKDGKWGILEIK